MTGQPLLRLLVGLLLGTLGVSLLPGSATAEPKPTLSQVQHRVSTLQHQAEQAIERYNTAKVSLAEATRRLRSARNRLAASQRRLDAKRALIGRIAVASYKAGALDSSVQLLLSDDPTQFLRQAADLVQLNRRQSQMLRGIEADRLRAAVDGKAVAEQRAMAQDLQQQLAAEKRTVQTRLGEARHLLGSLEAAQRARLAAIRRAAVERAVGARTSALRASRSARSGTFPTYDGPASGRAAVAVRTAYAQLGDPYVWAGSGPSSFDCSGLTMYVWAAAGVSLPHSSSAQYAAVRHVAESDLQPGDLVFYYSGISHVGIYIGGGRIIDAPYPGRSVHITGLHSMPYVGAGRP